MRTNVRVDGRRVHQAAGDARERRAADREGGYAHAERTARAQADAPPRLRATSARHLSVRRLAIAKALHCCSDRSTYIQCIM